YFGLSNPPGSAEFKGNQAATTFDPGPLDVGRTYYWRIDEVNAFGTTPGTVWSFTTPAILYVDADAPAGGDGRSWASAFKYLRDALDAAAPPAEIRVAAGEYKPDRTAALPNGDGNRIATFQLKSGLAVYGGFPPGGGDGSFYARNPA